MFVNVRFLVPVNLHKNQPMAIVRVIAYHINSGNYGKISLDGLNAIGLGSFEGNIWAGATKINLGFFFDERADKEQRESLQMIFSGKAGGFMAELAKLIGEIKGINFAHKI